MSVVVCMYVHMYKRHFSPISVGNRRNFLQNKHTQIHRKTVLKVAEVHPCNSKRPTHPNPHGQPNPTQPNPWVDPTHFHLWLRKTEKLFKGDTTRSQTALSYMHTTHTPRRFTTLLTRMFELEKIIRYYPATSASSIRFKWIHLTCSNASVAYLIMNYKLARCKSFAGRKCS